MSTHTPTTKAAFSGDREGWFLREVHAHDKPLRLWLRNQFPSVSDVDDVAQEAYLKIWRTQSLHPIRSAKSFLFTVARHLALDQLRRKQAAPFVPMDGLENLPCADERGSGRDQLVCTERINLLADSLVALPVTMRRALILHKLENLRQADVALTMNLTPKAVENYVLRGLERFRRFFAKGRLHAL